MKNITKTLVLVVLFAASPFMLSLRASAYSPSLSASRSGDGIYLSINNGAPSAHFTISYVVPSSTIYQTLDYPNFNTDYNGSFSTYLSGLNSTFVSGTQLYALFSNQDRTPTVALDGSSCGYYGCNNVGGLTFNPSSLSLSVGQSSTVYISSGVNMSYYPAEITSNSNSNVATANISGNQMTVTGRNAGSTSFTVCLRGGSTCGSIYVTVSGGYNGSVSFSESNVTLSAGQTKQVSIYGSYNYGSYSYYVSSVSNPNVVNATIPSYSNTLNLEAKNSGTANVTVCQNNYSGYCGTLYVTVTGNYNISFSPSSVSLNVGQSQSVGINGNGYYSSNYYYISSNSNSNAVLASIAGTSVYVTGNNPGSASITVCQSINSSCGTLYVTVNQTIGNWSLSQTNVTVNAGQSATVNANFPYVFSGNLSQGSNSNSNVATVAFSDSTIYVYGHNPGSATIGICYNSSCNNLYVTVPNYNVGSLSFTTTSLPQPTVDQYYNYQLQATGGTTPYYYNIQSGQLPAGLSLSSSGQIFGTPQNNYTANFTIRVYDNYSHSATMNFTLTPSGVLGSSSYNNGTLINEGGTVYIIYKNTKTGFASASAFLGLGFRFENVMNVGTTNLPFSGYTVTTDQTSHPWGSWIKSGQTVYFEHELGLIPVADYNTFLSNGGNDNLVVPANSFDFQRPVLSLMVANDTRLR